MENPDKLGYEMPAEWERMEAIWLAWPLNPSTWPGRLALAQRQMAVLIARLSTAGEVRLLCAPAAQAAARTALVESQARMEAVRFYALATNDSWIRDSGPTFLRHRDNGRLAMIDWVYNAWGGKFAPWDLDDAIPARLADLLQLPRFRRSLVCEGGAIEVNGAGLCLTTESVLLNPNRNPGWSCAAIAAELEDCLGAREVAWLAGGMETDDTDGHIDTLARFWKQDGVAAIVEKNERHPDHRVLRENWERLEGLRTPGGGRYDLAALPQPEPVFAEGTRADRLPASYANFVVFNKLVVVPAFGQPKADGQAVGLLRELFAGCRVESADALELLREGGAFHCLTQQQPCAGPAHRPTDPGP